MQQGGSRECDGWLPACVSWLVSGLPHESCCQCVPLDMPRHMSWCAAPHPSPPHPTCPHPPTHTRTPPLQAAVKEAEGWLGNASGLLGRARQLGPHPFVTLALFPGSSSVPALRTPFQVFLPHRHTGGSSSGGGPGRSSIFIPPAHNQIQCSQRVSLRLRDSLPSIPVLLPAARHFLHSRRSEFALLSCVITLLTPPSLTPTHVQAQTFCPQFHYQQALPIRLDAPTLTALATGEGSLELWHHCPRSQAVVAALSRGLSSSYAMTGQQQVFLGSATLPLQGLLIHPQVRCRGNRVAGPGGTVCWKHSAAQHSSAQHSVLLQGCSCIKQLCHQHHAAKPCCATFWGLVLLV